MNFKPELLRRDKEVPHTDQETTTSTDLTVINTSAPNSNLHKAMLLDIKVTNLLHHIN